MPLGDFILEVLLPPPPLAAVIVGLYHYAQL